MNLRLLIFLFIAASSPILFSACTSVESKVSEEVVISDATKGSREEVMITNSDLKKENEQISTSQETSQLPKRILSDKSEVQTMIDGFGNKTETRYFSEHLRLRFVTVRTPVRGAPEVTVYGFGGDTKVVADLGDRALTASGDEIANVAELNKTRGTSSSPQFINRRKTAAPLQPLPSSSFQKPVIENKPAVEPVPPETTNNSENFTPQQDSPNGN